MKNILLKTLISASTIAMAISSMVPSFAKESNELIDEPTTIVSQTKEETENQQTDPQKEIKQDKISIKKFFESKDNIESDRLIIRKMTNEDSLKIADFLVKPNMIKYLTDIKYKFTKKEQPLEYVFGRNEKGESKYINPYSQRYSILLKDSKTPIGYVVISEDHSFYVPSVTVGYAISDEYQKNGYCQEAVNKILKEMINDTYLIRVNFFCMSENKASLNVISKFGATESKQSVYEIETRISYFDKDSCLVKIIYKNTKNGKKFNISTRIIPTEILNYDGISNLENEKTFKLDGCFLTYHSYYNYDNLDKFFESEYYN